MGELRWYVTRRLVGMVLTAWVVLTIAFVLFTAKPDPNVWLVMFRAGTSVEAQREAVQAYKLAHNYDVPLLQRYVKWMVHYATLRWGTTLEGVPIAGLIGHALGETLRYLVPAVVVSTAVATTTGLYMAVRRGGAVDTVGTALAYGGYGVPAFFAAELAFGVLVHRYGMLWIPLDTARAHQGVAIPAAIDEYLLPFVILTLHLIATQLVFIRSEVTDVLSAEFMKTFRASGARSIDLARHAFRNATIPLVSSFFVQLLTILYLDIIAIEVAIGPNGFGQLTYNAFSNQDIGLILGVTIVPIAVGLVGNLFQDLAYTMLDPRVDLRRSTGTDLLDRVADERLPVEVETVVAAVVVVVVVGGIGAFVGLGGLAALSGGGPSSVVTTPVATPETTPTATPEPGLDVRVSYDGAWQLQLRVTADGTTTNRTLNGSGTEVVELDPAASRVYAAAAKRDESAGELLLFIVNDGQLIMKGSTTDPEGVVRIGPFIQETTATSTDAGA